MAAAVPNAASLLRSVPTVVISPSTFTPGSVDVVNSDENLVYLPNPSQPVELLCVSLYLVLAIVAACRAMSLPTRYSADEVKRHHTFQQLMVIFALFRTGSFLGRNEARDLLNRAAVCVFFSLVLFQVLFWIDIANPKVSRRSKRIWVAFTVSNSVFYALVLGFSILHVLEVKSVQANESGEYIASAQKETNILTELIPVILIGMGSLASSLGLIYVTCQMRRRVGRVLSQGGDTKRRRLDERLEAKLQRALRFTMTVMGICSIIFLMRTLLYLQRPFSHRGCGDITDSDVCIILGYAVPEVLSCTLFLILMWEVEPNLQFPSRRIPSYNSVSESSPLLGYDNKTGSDNPQSLAPSVTSMSITRSRRDNQNTKRRLNLLSRGFSGAIRRRLELTMRQRAGKRGGEKRTTNLSSEYGLESLSGSMPEKQAKHMVVHEEPSASLSASSTYAWFSFQCFNLKLPSTSTLSTSSFLVLHVLDPDTGNIVSEIGRSEMSSSEDPCFHLMFAVEMRSQDILRASVYAVRDQRSTHELDNQWLVGDAMIALRSFMVSSEFAFGRATLHQLFSPLSRTQSSGEIVVRCEAAVISASGVSNEGHERIIRSFMYFGIDDEIGDGLFSTSLGSSNCQTDTTSASRLHNSHRKVLVEEELIESVYTWEIPYQLLQLILSDLLIQVNALKRKYLPGDSESSAPSTPMSQLSLPSRIGSTISQPMAMSPGSLSIVPESESASIFSDEEDALPTEHDLDVNHESVDRRTTSIGMLSEMIFQIQGDAMERKKRKWRLELLFKMERYISEVEDAILRYGDVQHGGLTFKPSTMKADPGLRFIPLNLHQQLMTVGTAVPTSKDDVTYGDRGERYARLVNTFVGSFLASPGQGRTYTSPHGHLSDFDALSELSDDSDSDMTDSDYNDDEVGEQNVKKELPLEPAEALRRRVISFDSAETIVKMAVDGCKVTVPTEQRKLAETIVAMGMSEKNIPVDTEAINSRDSIDTWGRHCLSDEDSKSGKAQIGLSASRSGSHDDTAAWQNGSTFSRIPFERHRMYGTITVGAFAAHVYGFKKGGVRQMREELERLQLRLLKEAEKSSTDLTLEELEREYHELKWQMERRLEVAFCQAMSALVTCFQQTLYIHIYDNVDFGRHGMRVCGIDYLEMISQIGFLFSVESLLSTYSNEAGMLGDMDAAVKELARVQIKMRPVETPSEAAYRVSITSGPLGIVVELPIIFSDPCTFRQRNMHRVPGQDSFSGAVYMQLTSQEHRKRVESVLSSTIRVVPVLFSQGMNEMQTVANTVGKDALQKEINSENVVILERYFVDFYKWESSWIKSGRNPTSSSLPDGDEDMQRLQQMLNRLKIQVHDSGRSKRMTILSLSSSIARFIGGGRVTCCKSAKDRTSMSITLEEANLLVLSHGLHPDERDQFTSLLRTYGVRRENARKNIGKAQYCFSALQNYMLPNDYKCPPGTGGGSRSLS